MKKENLNLSYTTGNFSQRNSTVGFVVIHLISTIEAPIRQSVTTVTGSPSRLHRIVRHHRGVRHRAFDTCRLGTPRAFDDIVMTHDILRQIQIDGVSDRAETAKHVSTAVAAMGVLANVCAGARERATIATAEAQRVVGTALQAFENAR